MPGHSDEGCRVGRWRSSCLMLATAAIAPAVALAQEAASGDRAPIIVTAPAALFDADDLPPITAQDIRRGGRSDLVSALPRSLPSLALADATTNPFQPVLTVRGFSVSALQGAAQGIAVYADGVRFNLPFGDTVDLALLPSVAIDTVELRDSSAVHGLNAQGGALLIRTRTGASAPGLGGAGWGGRYGEAGGEAEFGHKDGAWSVYLGIEGERETGWRRFSPSRRIAGLADLGYDDASGGIHLKVAAADGRLTGNGAAPIELLEADRRAVFTHPDLAEPTLLRVSAHPWLALGAGARLEGTLYGLHYRQRTLNGDAADIEQCEEAPGRLCLEVGDDEEVELRDTAGSPIADLLGGEGYGLINRSRTRSRALGALVQFVASPALAGRPAHLVAGLSIDRSRTRFGASSELGEIEEDRGVEGLGPIIAIPGGPLAPVELKAFARYLGLFAATTVPLADTLSAELALRWNRARIRLEDQLGTALDGDHRFTRLNPGIELDWEAAPGLDLRLGWHQTNRVPTPAELGCADPEAPCSLANFFVADPPLKQVVTGSWEAGAGWERGGLRLDLSLWRATSRDDIALIASDVRGRAYFANVARTRRQGGEVIARGGLTPWLTASAGYAFTDATFRSSFALSSPNNPAADAEGLIAVGPGDRLPNVARHRGLLSLDAAQGPWRLGVDLQAQSGLRYLGDEIGALGTTGAFATVALRGGWKLAPALELFGEVRNLTDTRAATFGLLGEVDEVELEEAPGAEDPRFQGPLAPRRWRIGVRARF